MQWSGLVSRNIKRANSEVSARAVRGCVRRYRARGVDRDRMKYFLDSKTAPEELGTFEIRLSVPGICVSY